MGSGEPGKAAPAWEGPPTKKAPFKESGGLLGENVLGKRHSAEQTRWSEWSHLGEGGHRPGCPKGQNEAGPLDQAPPIEAIRTRLGVSKLARAAGAGPPSAGRELDTRVPRRKTHFRKTGLRGPPTYSNAGRRSSSSTTPENPTGASKTGGSEHRIQSEKVGVVSEIVNRRPTTGPHRSTFSLTESPGFGRKIPTFDKGAALRGFPTAPHPTGSSSLQKQGPAGFSQGPSRPMTGLMTVHPASAPEGARHPTTARCRSPRFPGCPLSREG